MEEMISISKLLIVVSVIITLFLKRIVFDGSLVDTLIVLQNQ